VVIPVGVESISTGAFNGCGKLSKVYYGGQTPMEWNYLSVNAGSGNTQIESGITVYYYSETQPVASGNFWHFADRTPTIWILILE
jgi:hypothetical protein